MALLSALTMELVIPVCAVIGIMFSLAQWCLTTKLGDFDHYCADIGTLVSTGVISFLSTGYRVYVGVFVVASAIILFLFLGSVDNFSIQSRPCTFNSLNMCKPALATAVFSAVSFLLGAFTSVLSGLLGMKIAIDANAWTALEEKKGVGRAFHSAFRSGAVMGFLHAAIGLLMLYLTIKLFKLYYGNDWEGLFEAITGFSLGGSSVALLGRASGGIYAKAADICAHLVEQTEAVFRGDDRNPAVILDCVGDVVGDIAGVGTDLFGSYAESSCVALVVASISSFGIDHDFTAMCYPLLISSVGILACFITTFLTADISRIDEVRTIRIALQNQLTISTILMTFGIAIVSLIALPSSFTIYNFGLRKAVKNWQLGSCVAVGLWARLIIGHLPDVPANNDRFELASVNIPSLAVISIFISFSFAATYGIALAALGTLSPIATRLAIDAYGPISDNAKCIARIADVTAHDDAGNPVTAIGKGSATESAALVSISLFGAFVSRAAISPVDVLTQPMVFIGVIFGGMLPYWFSSMTMKSVGSAGLKMFQVVHRQLVIHDPQMHHQPPACDGIFEVATDASMRGIVLPGALVMLTPFIVGTLFGVETLSGVLAGSLGSVAWIAISASNTGGAWDKAKNYIRAGATEYVGTVDPMTLDPGEEDLLRTIVSRGDAIGDEMKDTSGPPLNILIQLMAVESLMFTSFFATNGGLLFKIF